MKKKKIFITLIIIVILLIISVLLICINKKENKYVEEIIEENYFLLNDEEKYGVIDKEGNIIINPIYDMVQIPNASKPIFICLSNYDTNISEFNTIVLNDKNEQILGDFEKVFAIEVKDITSKLLYKSSVLKYKEDGKYGLISLNGNKITESKYDSIENLEYKNDELLVEEEGKYGVIKTNGKVIINSEYYNITADKYYNEKTKYQEAGFIVSQKNDSGFKYGYINNKGKLLLKIEYNQLQRVVDIKDDKNIFIIANKNSKEALIKNKKIVLDFEYDMIEYNYINNVYYVSKDNKNGVIDKKGKILLDIEFDEVSFSGIYITAKKDGEEFIYKENGELVKDVKYISLLATSDKKYYITLDNNNLYGVINQNEEQVIANNYNYIEYVFEDFFIVSKDSKVGIINKEGKSVIDIKYDVIEKMEKAHIIKTVVTETEHVDLYNSSMSLIASLDNADAYEKDNYVKLYSENEIKYFSLDGTEIKNTDIFKENSIIATKQDNKWGFKNSTGEIVLECKYDMVTELNDYGFAGIRKDNKWGVVNQKGEIIIEPIYEIEVTEPEFIGKYFKVYYGYGLPYYTQD